MLPHIFSTSCVVWSKFDGFQWENTSFIKKKKTGHGVLLFWRYNRKVENSQFQQGVIIIINLKAAFYVDSDYIIKLDVFLLSAL